MIDRLSNEMRNGGLWMVQRKSRASTQKIDNRRENRAKFIKCKAYTALKKITVCIRHEKYGKTVKGQGY